MYKVTESVIYTTTDDYICHDYLVFLQERYLNMTMTLKYQF